MGRQHWYSANKLRSLGLVAIICCSFHALSSLVLTTLVLAPSSPEWRVVLLLGSLFTIAGAAVGAQSFQPANKHVQWWASLLSGASSIALMGGYSAGQLWGQQAALLGTTIGCSLGGGLGILTFNHRGWVRIALILLGSLCAYGSAFGFSAWAIAAMAAQRWSIALGLGMVSGLYLWITQRSLKWTYHQWLYQYRRN
ncbi:MAG: hypothetical protein AAF821_15360 [Cyanobacteria bacterium P01_D01_bin.156]